MGKNKKQISITLEEKLLDSIEKNRGMIPRSRWIEAKLKEVGVNVGSMQSKSGI